MPSALQEALLNVEPHQTQLFAQQLMPVRQQSPVLLLKETAAKHLRLHDPNRQMSATSCEV